MACEQKKNVAPFKRISEPKSYFILQANKSFREDFEKAIERGDVTVYQDDFFQVEFHKISDKRWAYIFLRDGTSMYPIDYTTIKSVRDVLSALQCIEMNYGVPSSMAGLNNLSDDERKELGEALRKMADEVTRPSYWHG